jgi:hypothetical protein
VEALTDIANKYGTDKGTAGPDKSWAPHNYTDIYQAYLERMRHRQIILLEIGLGINGPHWAAHIQRGRNTAGGASIKMWEEYFPSAKIFGLDVNPVSDLNTERAITFRVDQADVDDLSSFVRAAEVDTFDIIIDDGSHIPEHQQVSVSSLFPYLTPGGLYFIEDLMANGVGDAATGRQASSDILNTREVLRQWSTTGMFAHPNALVNEEDLQQSIASMCFHCPDFHVGYRLGPPWFPKPIRRVNVFEPLSERLCAIQKSSEGQ